MKGVYGKMSVLNFNDHVRQRNGDLKTLETMGGSSTPYTLPPATSDTLGGVKIGSGVDVADDGTISVSGGGNSGFGNRVIGESSTNGIISSGDSYTATQDGFLYLSANSTCSYKFSGVALVYNFTNYRLDFTFDNGVSNIFIIPVKSGERYTFNKITGTNGNIAYGFLPLN